MSYLALKHLHVGCVVLSGLGFLLRGIWMWRAVPWRQHRLVRTLPHLVDSVLLGSALALAWQSQQFPLVDAWLTAKLGGLIAYVGLGAVALRGRTAARRRLAFALALLAFAYIVSVALTRCPMPWLGVSCRAAFPG